MTMVCLRVFWLKDQNDGFAWVCLGKYRGPCNVTFSGIKVTCLKEYAQFLGFNGALLE